MEVPKHYDAKVSEAKWQKFWEDNKIHSFNPKSKKEVYSIDTPPPTVSGKMHIGHSFSYSQQDFIARFQRMSGKNVFYPFGTDDNGLATERLIERMKNVKGQFMKRKEFVELCLKTLEEIRPDFIYDWKRLGISADFSIFYTTIDKHCQRISQKSFIELYKDGRIYRKRSPFMWCPECQTAIAQVELKDSERDSKLVYMKFDTSVGEKITIATTRPELLPACVAVHVHPDDGRYKKFIGANAKIPFSDREVKIESNKDVAMDFGSGVVYHCTFGDMDDVKWLEEYKLEAIEIVNKDGTLNEKAGMFNGLKVKKAREAVINALQDEGRIEKIEPINHVANVHERCETDIEILMTDQWFIKYLELKEEFVKFGSSIKWHPEHMKSRYINWINGLKWDWCISRQRHFGIPIPVWYCKKCGSTIIADEKKLPVDPTSDFPKQCKCGSSDFIGEKDVLDTWATSSLTPQIAIELYKDEKLKKKLFPMSLRPQAHDIITFWLFNTVVKSYFHHKSKPWNNVMISGWALDPHGKKMSKSKGNVVDPREVISKYSADCLRFWAAGSKLGDDMPFQEKDLVTGQKFVTKLWNASKFSFIHLSDYIPQKPKKLHMIDKWILSKLTSLVNSCTESMENYEYSKSKAETELFFWHVFCDDYLEFVKERLYNHDRYEKDIVLSAKFALYTALLSVVKLMSPFTPYITEEVYQSYFRKNEKEESVHVSEWPFMKFYDEEAEKTGDFFAEVVRQARKMKSSKQVSLKAPIKSIKIKWNLPEKDFNSVKSDLMSAIACENISYASDENLKDIEVDIEM